MKKLVFGLLAAVVLLAGSAVPSWAGGWHYGRHGGWRGPVVFVGPRFVVGTPWVVGPYYYPRPYVYAAPVVVAPPVPVVAAPPVYTQSQQYWYYCQNPAGYYPSVPQCPTQWMQVSPQPQ